MPIAPAIPAVDEEEDPVPAAPKPRIGSTGGEIPDQASDIAARQPVRWSADPAQRQAQVADELEKRKSARFEKEHPFTPSSFRPKPPINAQGQQIATREDRQFEAGAEDQFQFQQQQERAREIETRRTAIEQQKNANDTAEAQYRGSGQQFYTDAHGRIVPVMEAGTNRPLFNKTGWEAGTHPETGKPTMMMRDKYGQRQFKEAPVVPSLDPSDDQMYYKMPDGTTTPAGSIDDFAKHPNYQVAKAALAAKTRQVKEVHKQALQPLKLMVDQAASQLEDARSRVQALDADIEKTTTKIANAAGADGSATPLSEGLTASLQQMQAERDALDAQTKPKGDLARRAARARAGYTIASATAMREAFAAQHAEIAARVKSQGGKLESDPTYQANLRGMQSADEILKGANSEFDGTEPSTSTPVSQPGAPAATSAAAPGVLEQSEPFAAAQKGVTHIGAVKLPEFARRYGDGQGPVKPDQLLKLYQRSKELDQTLTNEATTVNQTLRDNLQKEKDYVEALAKQRFARLPEDQQKRVADITRDSNFWDKTKGAGKSVAEGAAKGGGSVFKGLAQIMDKIGPMGDMQGFHISPDQIRATEQWYKQRKDETPSQRMERIKADPVYKFGTFIQDAAKDAYAKSPHEEEGMVSQAINAASEAAGGFAPLVASGPAAPLTAGLQATGDQMEALYNEQIQKGVDKERAAKFAVDRALVSGGVQAALFAVLPKPLQKAGSKVIVDKIAGDGLMKFLANRVAQAGEGAVVGGATKAAENLTGDRPIGEGVSEAAAGMAAMQTVMPRAGGTPKKPKGGEPAPKVEPKPPLTPEQKAAEVEFQKQLAEPATPPKAKSAAESAEVFEPALKEKENTPPPAKSAKESATAIADVQDTAEASAKVLSQQEGKAQKLVDQIQEATGKPREEILATRKGRDVAEWAKELETEAKYQKSPLTVDPERRATELRADLKKLDTEWDAHREMVSANAERLAKTPGEGDVYKAMFEADRARHQSLEERRTAIEKQLTEADRLRQSAKGGEELNKDLAKQEGRPPPEEPGAAAAKKTEPEPPAGGKSDYDRYQEISSEWAKAVKEGKADMNRPEIKALFTENEAIKNRHGGMPPEAPKAAEAVASKSSKEMLDDIMAKNPNADPEATKMLLGKKKYEVRDIPISEIGEVFGSKTVQPEVVKKYEATKSDEPIVLGKVAGSTDTKLRPIDGKHRLTAAINRGDKTIKAYVPVDEVAAKSKSEKPSNVAQTKAQNEAPVLKAGGETVVEPKTENAPPVPEVLKRPKDAAPVSADITTHTPETVEGAKINKAWTAFGKESGTLGIPREQMPQIKSEHRGALVNFLKARGVQAKTAMVLPEQLKPTQAEFSPAKVDTAREFRGSERPVIISSDGHVVDGHHQWMAGLQDDPKTPMPVIKLNAPIDKVLAEVKEFPSTESAKGVAAKSATKEPSVSAPATKRLSDRAIEALESAKYDIKSLRKSVVAENEGATPKLIQLPEAYKVAHNAAIDLAILGVRAGRALNDVVKLAIDRFKAKYPGHTKENLQQLESDIRAAVSGRPPEPEPGTAKSKVPESLREVGVPAKDITYDVRAQNARMIEARTEVAKDPAKAEQMISDRNLPADTRVALGGVLLEKKMEQIAKATPEQLPALTRDIERITEATRAGVSTESGQGVAMHSKIYENLGVGSAMEYTKAASRQQLEKLGGEEAGKAAKEAAEIFNKTKDQKARDAEIEKLKKKYSTKPAQRMLDQLKQIETVQKLDKLGVLTREDMVNVAGNALGIPGVDAKKLKHIAELSNRVTNAKNHAEKSRAELELADTLSIYKGVNPLDLEASILTLNILSGPSTQAANLEGNALNLLAQLGTTAAVNPTKIGPIMRGLKEGIPLGWDQAKSILMTGRGTKDFQDRTLGSSNALQNVDYARDFSKLNSKVGDALTLRARAVEKISRFMKGADAVFYYPAREAYARLAATKLLEGDFKGAELVKKVSETLHTTPEAFEAARKQATLEGYTGVDRGRRVSDIIEENRAKTEVGKQVVKESERFGAEATFNNEPVGLAGVIYRNLARTVKDADVAGVPVVKPWAMFLRVPANVFNTTMNFTPVGAKRAFSGTKGEAYRKGGTGEGQWRNFTKDEQNKLYLQSIIGTTLMGALVTHTVSDKKGGSDPIITATGPADPNKRAQLKAAGWNPYSIKVGGRWISYKDSPLLIPLSIAGHVADDFKYQKSSSDTTTSTKLMKAVSQSPRVIFDTSMLSGLSDLMSTLSGHGDISSVTRTLGSIPANLLIPYNRLLQQIDQSFDETVYKGDQITDSVPFLRRTGEKQTDVQGRTRTFSPFSRFTTAEKGDPVDAILREKNIFIPEAGRDSKVGNRVMTDDEHKVYRRLSGQRIRARLQLIAPQLRIMTQEQAQKRVEQISREEREKIRPLIGAGIRH